MLKLSLILCISLAGVCSGDFLSDGNANEMLEYFATSMMFDNTVSSNCKRDLLDYLIGVIEGEVWAVSMFDSIEKFPSGLMEGKSEIIGQYHECINAVHQNFTGQHCMVELRLKKNSTHQRLDQLQERFSEGQFSYGLCVPSSCSSTDLSNFFRLLQIDKVIHLEINQTSCTVGNYQKMRPEDWATLSFIIVIILISLASTAYDIYHKVIKKESQNTVLRSFSLYYNSVQLFQKNKNTSQINVLNGMKFLSMAWILACHFYGRLSETVSNKRYMLSNLNSKLYPPLINAYHGVDTFLFISGLLLATMFFRDISKKGSFDAPLSLINRYFRLTPIHAFMFLIHCTIFSRLGNGPIWNTESESMESVCRRQWWSNLLYFDNIIGPTSGCLPNYWYMCAEFQMYAISPLILYIILLYPRFAPVFTILLTLGSSLSSFIMTIKNDLSLSNSKVKGLELRYEFFQFYTRMGPWVLGIATGYILHEIHAKKINFNLSKISIFIGWFVSLSLLLVSIYGITAFMPFRSYLATFKKSSYGAIQRISWSVGLAWIIIASEKGYGGPIGALLSLDIFQPLSKVNYAAFLVSSSVQTFRSFSVKSIRYYTFYDFVYTLIGDLVVCTLLAIPLTLLIEMPVIQIVKHYTQNLEIFPIRGPPKLKEKEAVINEKPKGLI